MGTARAMAPRQEHAWVVEDKQASEDGRVMGKPKDRKGWQGQGGQTSADRPCAHW